MKIGRVKIFNPDAGILAALADSGLEVVVAIPNDQIGEIGGDDGAAAEAWVAQNVAAYYPATNIVTILVGNEVFSDASLPWAALVPAIQNLDTALAARGWSGAIKVSTAVAADVLSSSYPPSAGTFRPDIAVPVILPLLTFLSASHSYFFVNLYPFLAYATSAGAISLGYATFAGGVAAVADGALRYTNLLDAQLDAVVAAMEKLGVDDVRVAVGESGWPTKADASQPGASVPNAAAYNRRLVRKTLASSGGGTPKRPGVFIPTFIFALFNEDLKPGPVSERNWGLLYPSLTPVYPIDLTGQLVDSQYAPISA
jgi:exo-beta-1,3-glucanase (GH17 family)